MASYKPFWGIVGALLLSFSLTSPSFGQTRFGNLRYSSSANTIRDMRGFTGRTFGYSLGNFSSYQSMGGSMGSSSSNLLRTNQGGYSSMSGGSAFKFSGSRFGAPVGGPMSGLGRSAGQGPGGTSLTLANNFDYNGNASTLGSDSIIALPRSSSSADLFLPTCQPSSDADICTPYMEKKFLRPGLRGGSSKTPAGNSAVEMNEVRLNSDGSSGGTTHAGAFSIARQMAQARDYFCRQKYNQALTSYQMAQTVGKNNLNSLVGMIYCHILSGKFQVAGLNVHRLMSQFPNFWRDGPDFDAVFGLPRDEVVRQVAEIVPKVNEFCSRYNPEDSRQVAEDLKWVHLSMVYMAWLTGDTEMMRENATRAAKVAPFDEKVQKLFFQVTGVKETKEPLKLQPMKPLE